MRHFYKNSLGPDKEQKTEGVCDPLWNRLSCPKPLQPPSSDSPCLNLNVRFKVNNVQSARRRHADWLLQVRRRAGREMKGEMRGVCSALMSPAVSLAGDYNRNDPVTPTPVNFTFTAFHYAAFFSFASPLQTWISDGHWGLIPLRML